MTSILVIDASRAIRETLSIVLGHEFQVSTAEHAASAAAAEPALLILGLSSTDDETPVRTLLARRPTVPTLFLHAAADLSPTLLAPGERRIGFLRKPFDGHALRTAVRSLLTPASAADAVASRSAFVLEHPFLTEAAAAIVRQSITLDLPLLFVGEPGTGARVVARAAHQRVHRSGTLRVVTARDLSPDDLRRALAEPDAGVLLDGVAALPLDTQHALILALEAGARGRVFATTPEPLEAAVARGGFLAELAYPLGVLTATLPPLRDRIDDLPGLIETLRVAHASRLGLPLVSFSDAAVDRLCHYLWFGNVDEMDAVLARTMAAHRSGVVGPDELLFVPGQTVAVPTSPRARPAVASLRAPTRAPGQEYGHARLEVLLGELAHELRNPMVTIKTFSQHLDSVLADPDVRSRFTTLTQEAVARMDGLLEQLLEFARFRTPVLETLDLGPLIDQALVEQRDELTRRGVRLERNGARPGAVEADRAQVQFALRSLLDGLVHELVPHETLKMTVPESGAFELEAHAEPATAARLTAFVEGADTETDETPTLPFALAAALLERNGGRLRVRNGADGATVVRVDLAPVGT